VRIGDGCDKRTRQQRTYPGDIHQSAPQLGLSRTRADPAIVFEDLFLHDPELGLQHPQAKPCVSGYSGVVFVVDDDKQLLDSIPPDRRHDPELGQVGSHRVRYLRALAVEH
jgi:hypothetical protein